MFWIFKSEDYSNSVVEVSPKNRSTYLTWRLRIFCAIYFGYIFFCLTRKGFAFAAPLMLQNNLLTTAEIGAISTAWSIAYGISKFISGIAGDRSNPRYFMPFGLFLTGACNFCFGMSNAFWIYVMFWALNGWFQGTGWPSCAKCLTYWFPAQERGYWWGAWNTCHNLAGVFIPLLYANIGAAYGWRAIFIIPATIAIFASVWLFGRLRDQPLSLGLPSVEAFYDEPILSDHSTSKTGAFQATIKHVLCKKSIWLLGLAGCFLYATRTGMHDWLTFFFMHKKGYSYIQAGSCLLWFELGGIFGGFLGGWVSDKWFSSRRAPVMLLAFCFFFVVLSGVMFGSVTSYPANAIMLFFSGTMLFVPQMLIGLTAAELTSKTASASVTGFVGFFGQIGAAMAGYPFGVLIQQYGWSHFSYILMMVSFFSFSCLCPILVIEEKKKRS